MSRRGISWIASILFVVALVAWGWATVRDTVSTGLVMGEQAPDAVLVDLDGQPVRLSDFSGQPLILRFSSRTCSFCYDDFGFLEQLQQQYGDDLHIIAIEVGVAPDGVRDAVRGRDESYTVLVDAGQMAVEAYQPQLVPQNYFINADGMLLSRSAGELMDLDYRAHVAQILRDDGQGVANVEDEIKAVAEAVRCQECQGQSVWQSQAPSAWQMREEIEDLFAEGLNRTQVINELVDHYGVWILMTPPAEGRFVWVYLTPFIAIGVGGLVAYWLVNRRRRNGDDDDDTDPEKVDAETEARIQRRLREYL